MGKPIDNRMNHYRRIVQLLKSYWIEEPDEKRVEVTLHFEHIDGQTKDAWITWHNPKYCK